MQEQAAENQARASLPATITVNRAEACPDNVKYQIASAAGHPCTSIRGLRLQVVPALTNIQREFGSPIQISGGTECGHVEHVDGQTVDIVASNFDALKRHVGFYGSLIPLAPQGTGPGRFQYLGLNASIECDTSPPYNCQQHGNFAFLYGLRSWPLFALEGDHYVPTAQASHFHVRLPTDYAAAITVNKDTSGGGDGTVNSDLQGISCSPSCTAQFTKGAAIVLSATANSQSIFNLWTGLNPFTDPPPNGASATILADSSRTITAKFDSNTGGGGGGGPPPPPPPGSGPGGWQWDPTLNGGLGGWVWTGTATPQQGTPPPGCGWHWDPTIGHGAWIHDICLPCRQFSLSSCNPGGGLPITSVTSGDPNEKAGPHGTGTARFLSGSQAFNYSIYFENQPTATAPAQTIAVTDTLNGTLVDLSTLTLGPISFTDKVVNPPSVPLTVLGTYSASVDLRPAKNLIIAITAALDSLTGVLRWTFTSLDPATGLLTTDPLAGLLPPGAEGSVSFNVAPKAPTGTQIANKATIVFDLNPAIDTPVWSNTIDRAAPTSRVAALPATQTTSCFKPQWSGSDVGVGMKGFSVFVSDNGSPFAVWLTNTTATSAVFNGLAGHTYSFYSQATDLVGNIEGAKTAAEATTGVSASASCNGRPSLAGAVASKASLGTTMTLALQLTNSGLGDAQNVVVNQLTFRTLNGAGTVTLSNPAIPLSISSLGAGVSSTVNLTLNVPSSVKQFSITEQGTLQDLAGSSYTFAIAQTVIP